MRIIGGSLGGRRLKAPPGSTTRPTSDRVREAIFNILGPPPPHARVLDLFAGAGSLGLEALSRGAARAEFVDHSQAAARCVRQNARALGVDERCRVHCQDALALLRRWCESAPRRQPAASPGEPLRFDWGFVDPPYQGDLAARALEILGQGELIGPGAVVVVEHDRRHVPANTYGSLVRTDHRRYGDTEVSFYRIPAPAPPRPEPPCP
jgi:16S rRNA (guanine(966)-N(2))-methyltransferase RsmD